MLDYWSSLSGELEGTHRSRAYEIMRYKWMSVPEPTSCVATRVAALVILISD